MLTSVNWFPNRRHGKCCLCYILVAAPTTSTAALIDLVLHISTL